MTQRKRVAFVNTTATSLNHLMRGQLEFLQSLGVEIDLYCGSPDGELQALRKRKVGRVQYVPFRRRPHLFWDLICLLWLIVLLSLRRYDAVIYSTPKAMLLGSLAAFVTGQPWRVAWVRGRGYENLGGWRRRLYVALDQLTFRISHRVLFISPSLAAAYGADGVSTGRKERLVDYGSSNGVDLDRFRPLARQARSELRAELGLTPHNFVVLVVGRITRDKGTIEVLELGRRLRDLQNLRVLLVGTIEDLDLKEKIFRKDQHLLRWHPPTHDIERLFQIADLHLFLSHREGFGNVAIEAAAVGVPTFAFDVVGVRDAVLRGRTGELYPLADLDSVESAIRDAVKDPSRFRTKYGRAREVVSIRFSQLTIWKKHAEIFLKA